MIFCTNMDIIRIYEIHNIISVTDIINTYISNEDHDLIYMYLNSLLLTGCTVIEYILYSM